MVSRKVYGLNTLRHHAREALASGGGVRPSLVARNCAGDCTDPVHRELEVRRTYQRFEAWVHPFNADDVVTKHQAFNDRGWRSTIELQARCRKCANCLRHRARLWAARMAAETSAAHRTWFGTLTLRPEEQFLAAARAQKASGLGPAEWAALSRAERFQAHVAECQREITLWLKRVRKESGASVRYCLVSEPHKSGLPHFHVLVHEVGQAVIRHRTLQGQWRLGFSSFKLADAKSAAYVAKYLTKAASARVRASRRYGKTISDDSPVGREY